MFLVIRVDAVRRQNHLPVSLIGINGRHTNAGMGVDACQNKSIGPETSKHLLKDCAIERTVSFLDNDSICRVDHQVGRYLGSLRSLYRDAYSLCPHVSKCIFQVWPEFLPDPNDRPAGTSDDARECVG